MLVPCFHSSIFFEISSSLYLQPFIKGLCTIEFAWVQDLLPLLRTASVRKLVGSEDLAALQQQKQPTSAISDGGTPPEDHAKTPAVKSEAEQQSNKEKMSNAKERYLARKKAQELKRQEVAATLA